MAQKMVIKRLGVLSIAKIYGLICAVFGLIIGVFYGLIFAVFGAMLSGLGRSSSSGSGAVGAGVGFVFAVILFPILYGIIGFIAGAIGAAIYNLAAGWMGGVEMDLDTAGGYYAAPQPPQYPPQY